MAGAPGAAFPSAGGTGEQETPGYCPDQSFTSYRFEGIRKVCALDLDDVFLRERSGWVVVRSGKGGKRREVP